MYVNVSWGSSAWSEMIKSFSVQKSSNKPPNVYLKFKGTSFETDLDDFVDEIDTRHDKRRIKLRWGDDDIKFEACVGICVKIILLIAYLSESFLA